ncbi:MAG: bifunctional DNA-formamidopyrimidine glycosylase/DNA-(apurinic or apyrimidinic site) lyase [Patescibacteria group bacterium]
MPELPEVHTIVTDLKKFLPGLKITGIWTDIPKFKKIKKDVVGEKILKVERRGKNILIHLSSRSDLKKNPQGQTLLVHQKMTGHLMFGKWELKNKKWKSVIPGAMRDDPENRFIHLLFFLSNGKHLALCDMRKFANVIVLPEKIIKEKLEKLGPEPFDKNFDLKRFSEIIKNKGGKIKSVLMDQGVIAGIGNIYSDEILWLSGVHPLKIASRLKKNEIKKIYTAIRPVLKKAIKARGSSYIDYRDAQGKKGKYQEMQNAYGLKGKKCKRPGCGGIIEKIVVGGRSAHFCPKHQTKYD